MLFPLGIGGYRLTETDSPRRNAWKGLPMMNWTSIRLWRIAGGLAIAHVLLMLGSFALQRVAKLGAAQSTVVADHMQWPAAKGFGGGYLTVLSLLVFVVCVSLFGRLLRGSGQVTGWLTSIQLMAAALYVAATFAGMADLGGALYGGGHDMPIAIVTALVEVHWFSIYLATAALGLFTLAISATIQCTQSLRPWIAYLGYVVGAVCVLSLPAAGGGLVDTATLIWLIWFVALAVMAIRGPRVLRVGEGPDARPVPAAAETNDSITI